MGEPGEKQLEADRQPHPTQNLAGQRWGLLALEQIAERPRMALPSLPGIWAAQPMCPLTFPWACCRDTGLYLPHPEASLDQD